ncbi:MAG: glycosyltransferase [Rhodoferax sp.]|uniref:glycosyltransferase n=1 Tax=Rhodoferax sp. TaxID=50421 RepID=UPI0008AF1937|nr:glycosyltransferase [Rhodoferax sp.]MDP2679674.1 glycosyltransferase [Rhodoferax sp.]OGB50950.1 MAG: glycosyl transferase family 1 [Burkholderiales bacterium RIFOXYD12_FULL_59_19]OGB71216.1 MAG: glycosyl transferase family 1 [Burkholderiales bacterium RIFOXYC12_FULL_60_6]
MKILFISDVYFPRINGVSTSMETYHRNLRLLGHIVHVIAPDYSRPSSDETDIMRVPSRRVPFDPEDRLMSFKWVMNQLAKIRSENYDIIHIQTPFVAHYLGVKLSRMLGIPCVETYHTFFEEYLHHYVPLVPKKVTRFLATRFSRHQGNSLDGMVVPSKPMLKVLKSYGITTQTEVIPTGIEPASFVLGDRAAFRAKHGIPQGRPVILFVGRVAHEKNIGFLLKVVDRIRHEISDVLFVIAGEGPAVKSLEHEVMDLRINENVMFVDYLDRHTDLNDCYRAADVFVFSSRTETQGLVLLEAMAQGVPVVSIAELGTRDVLRDGVGVLIAREELTDFSGKVVAMLGDEKGRKALGDSGREYASEWSAKKQAKRMLNFYISVLKFPAEPCESGD